MNNHPYILGYMKTSQENEAPDILGHLPAPVQNWAGSWPGKRFEENPDAFVSDNWSEVAKGIGEYFNQGVIKKPFIERDPSETSQGLLGGMVGRVKAGINTAVEKANEGLENIGNATLDKYKTWEDVPGTWKPVVLAKVKEYVNNPENARRMVNQRIAAKVDAIKQFMSKNKVWIGGALALPLLFMLGRGLLGGSRGSRQQPMYVQPPQQAPINPMRRFW
jgi:hypothetical protein